MVCPMVKKPVAPNDKILLLLPAPESPLWIASTFRRSAEKYRSSVWYASTGPPPCSGVVERSMIRQRSKDHWTRNKKHSESTLLSQSNRFISKESGPGLKSAVPAVSVQRRVGIFVILTWILLLRESVVCASLFTVEGEFHELAQIGGEYQSSNTASGLVVDSRGDVYVTGVSEPESRFGASDLPGATSTDLKGRDLFIAKLSGDTGDVLWTIRTGTSQDDDAYAIGIDEIEGAIYIVGRTSGQFGDNPKQGQTDAFLLKYDVSERTSKPTMLWGGPRTFGTSAADVATHLFVDNARQMVYVAGSTKGQLFPGVDSATSLGNDDCFLATFHAFDGRLQAGRQFGSEFSDRTSALYHAPAPSETILVAADTVRTIGDIGISNTNVFKFTGSALSNGKSFLVRTFARERAVGLATMQNFPGDLFIAGSSWLEQITGWQLAYKRISLGIDDSTTSGDGEIPFSEVEVTSFKPGDEFSSRFGSESGGITDQAYAMYVDPITGIAWIAGTTSGTLPGTNALAARSSMAIAALDPISGTTLSISQEHHSNPLNFSSLSQIVRSGNSSTLFYCGARVDEKTGALSATIGTFGMPSEWVRTVFVRPPRESPGASPLPAPAQREGEGEEGNTRFLVLVGGASAGGLVVVLLVVCSFCAIRRTKKRTQEVLKPQVPAEAEMPRARKTHGKTDASRFEGRAERLV